MAECSLNISWSLNGTYGIDKHSDDYTPYPYTYIPVYSVLNSVKVQINSAYQDIKLGSTNGKWYVKIPADGDEVYLSGSVVTKTKQNLVSDDIKSYFQSGTEDSGYLNSSYTAMRIGFTSGITRPWYVSGANLIYDYTPSQYTLKVQAGEGGTVTGGGTWDVPIYGEEKEIIATPNRNWKFIKWVDSDGNEYSSSALTITINTPHGGSSGGDDIISISATNTEKTYTAYFERMSYTINYDARGTGYSMATGVSHSGTMDSQTATVAENITFPLNTYKQYYTVTLNPNCDDLDTQYLYSFSEFKGWEDNGSITADSGETFSYTQFDAPFYANTYPDLYNAFGYNKLNLVNHWVNNGKSEGRQCVGEERGLYPDGAVVNSIADGGSNAFLCAAWGDFQPVYLPDYITRSSYIFEGWYTSATGGEKVEGDYLPDGSVTLYAHWRDGYWSLCELLNDTKKPLRILVDEHEVKKIFVDERKVYASFAATQGNIGDVEVIYRQVENNRPIKIPLINFTEQPDSISLFIDENEYHYPLTIGSTSDCVWYIHKENYDNGERVSLGDYNNMVLTLVYDGRKYQRNFRVMNTKYAYRYKRYYPRIIIGENQTFAIAEHTNTGLFYEICNNYSDTRINEITSDNHTINNIKREEQGNYDIIQWDITGSNVNSATTYYKGSSSNSKVSLSYNDNNYASTPKPGYYKWVVGIENILGFYSFNIIGDPFGTTDFLGHTYNFSSDIPYDVCGFSIAKIHIKAMRTLVLKVSYEQQTTTDSNFCIFSELDKELFCSMDEDNEYKGKTSYSSKNTEQKGEFYYDVPVGEHFFYVKYVQKSTEYKYNEMKFYIEAPEFSKEDTPVYTIEGFDGADYGFTLKEDGYYESDNSGIYNTFAICKVAVSSSEDCKLYIDFSRSGGKAFLSPLDDETYRASLSGEGLWKWNSNSSYKDTVRYDIPIGEHYFYVKFINENAGTNYFRFKIG